MSANGLVEYRCPHCNAWLFDTVPSGERLTTKCRNRRCPNKRAGLTVYLDPPTAKIDTRVDLQTVAPMRDGSHTPINAAAMRAAV